MTDSSIIQKIRALLAKAQDKSVTEAEAFAFAEKAREMMEKYNLSQHDVSEDTLGSLHQLKRVAENWEWRIGQATARMFNCAYFSEQFTAPTQPNSRQSSDFRVHEGHVFVGRQNDRITAELLCEFFIQTIKKLGKEWIRENGGTNIDWKHFCRACCMRVVERINAVTPETRELQVADEYMKEEFKIVTGKQSLTVGAKAGAAGYEAGDRVGINVQTEGKGSDIRIAQVQRLT